MLRYFLVALLVVALAGGTYFLLTPEGRQLFDRAHIKLERAEHHVWHLAGKPLRGTPELDRLDARLKAAGVELGVPVHLRIFKLESEIELGVEKDGRFERFATYPICFWSGRLGPKLKERDLQAPEGFYTVAKDSLNPNSSNHRSFNLGFPNAYDREKGRTGSLLMVHGGCKSIGCYAVTDGVVDELWRFVAASLENGQKRIPVHAFPFRMTDSNAWVHSGNKWSGFWTDLKKGYDLFEQNPLPPVVSVCNGRYVFEEGSIATAASAVEKRCP